MSGEDRAARELASSVSYVEGLLTGIAYMLGDDLGTQSAVANATPLLNLAVNEACELLLPDVDRGDGEGER